MGVEGLFYIKGSNIILLNDHFLNLNLLRVFMVGEMKGVPIEELGEPKYRKGLEDAILEITVYGRDLNINSSDLAE